MSFSDADVVHPAADAPSSRRKLLRTLWCLLVSQTSLCGAVACFADCLPCLCGCSLFRDRRISGHLQLQQRRSRKDGDHPLERPGARMKRQLLGRIARGEDRSSELGFFFSFYLPFSCAYISMGFRLGFQALRERRRGRSWDIIWREPRE